MINLDLYSKRTSPVLMNRAQFSNVSSLLGHLLLLGKFESVSEQCCTIKQ